MSVGSILSYLEDEIRLNKEKIQNAEKFIQANPSKSILKRKIGKKYYYYLNFWQDGRPRQKYIGKDSNVLDSNRLKEIKDKQLKIKRVKENYHSLKLENKKLIKILHYVKKIDAD